LNRLEIGDVAERYPVVILAAGASRRMGRPKALLDFGSRCCLERLVDACRRSGQGPIVVVLGSGAGAILQRLRPAPGIRVVLNADHERGQTSSVKAGLRAVSAGSEGIFLLPVDHPLVEPSDLEALAGGFAARGADTTMRIPTHRGRRGHPLLISGEHRQAILGMDDAVPLHDFVRAREKGIELVERPGPGVITGINTEHDYGRALAILRAT
jgi:molybdenum cofactor cytidylyltransferase